MLSCRPKGTVTAVSPKLLPAPTVGTWCIMCPQEAMENRWPSLGTGQSSAAPRVKLQQAVAKKREVDGLKASIRWSRLVWTNCDDQHGQPLFFPITTACYFVQLVST